VAALYVGISFFFFFKKEAKKAETLTPVINAAGGEK
jgi:hypothetical protein